MLTETIQLAGIVRKRFEERNEASRLLFEREAPRLAEICQRMSERFLSGGRLVAFGRGSYATDAQHVSVEFVHPVIVGKRALPALDVSASFGPWLRAVLRADDMVMGFGPPEGDPLVLAAIEEAHARGALTLALPGRDADYAVSSPSEDPFIHQELIEVLYHTLWESVHVFFEHRELGHDVGEAGFLYPFLGRERQATGDLLGEVAASIRAKAADDERLRTEMAERSTDAIVQTSIAITERVRQGGTLFVFGNGGSATDANDLALDCVSPPAGYQPIPAVSLAFEPANITAIANDVGSDVIFLRQLIAHARAADVAVAISTSGGSRNIIMALEEARKRGLLTVAILGYDGGEVVRRGLADCSMVVHSDYIPRIQEVQASTYHILRELLELRARGEA